MDAATCLNEVITTKNTTRDLLKFVICGSVDDGKSTLIGRLLYDADLIYEDHLHALTLDSQKLGLENTLDFSLLMDGLAAEREQKITIDIAYRFFATPKRAFIVADAPGHLQYTQNMATAASFAEVAVVLVDASKGLLNQTRRHTLIAALFGIQQVIFIVNKMDLVEFSAACFTALTTEYHNYATSLGIPKIHAIPVSALHGDNIFHRSSKTTWYQGQTLMQCLENIGKAKSITKQSFRLAVQWINRPNAIFRGVSGQILSGTLSPGDKIKILPSGQEASVARIVTFDGDLEHASIGQAVTITFKEDIDSSRGDILAAAEDPCEIADILEVDILWMQETPMTVGRQYGLRIGTTYATCTIAKPDYITDIDTLEKQSTSTLGYHQIGRCTLQLDRLIAYEIYKNNKALGGLIITEKSTQTVIAVGVISNGQQRSSHIPYQHLSVNQSMRAQLKLQQPKVLWLTGLSGAGKSTIANLLEKKLHAQGLHTMLLDANNLRHGLNSDLGFTDTCRIENIRRIAHVAKLMTDAGLITLVACIAPIAAERMVARQLIGEAYYEIFVDAPLAVVEARDVSGLYAQARLGKIKHFTGISSPYEPPQSPELHIDSLQLTAEQAVQKILDRFFS